MKNLLEKKGRFCVSVAADPRLQAEMGWFVPFGKTDDNQAMRYLFSLSLAGVCLPDLGLRCVG
jgi:hypothetical protein